MNRMLPLALASLVLSGCTSAETQMKRPTSATLLHDRNFDNYVTQRSDSLVRSGVFKDREDAEMKAREEATDIYGPIEPDFSTDWHWGAAKSQVSQSDIDEALAKMAREDRTP